MKHVFYNTACLERLRGQLAEKNITCLLILPVIIAILFPTLSTALAHSEMRDGSNTKPTPANMRSTSSNRLSGQATDPRTSIHMLDKTSGWILTQSSVLKTVDGGLHWQNVLPVSTSSEILHGSPSQGFFWNAQDAWIAIAQEQQNMISILRTTDGGKSWQSSIIPTSAGSSSDTPRFSNPSNGWASTSANLLLYTINGGRTWQPINTSINQKSIGTLTHQA